jgi:hypothetical protein
MLMTPHLLPIDKQKPRFDAFCGNFWTSLSQCTDPHVIVWSLRGTLLFANTCRTFTPAPGPMRSTPSLPPSFALHRLFIPRFDSGKYMHALHVYRNIKLRARLGVRSISDYQSAILNQIIKNRNKCKSSYCGRSKLQIISYDIRNNL